jgi:hypothetical protein
MPCLFVSTGDESDESSCTRKLAKLIPGFMACVKASSRANTPPRADLAKQNDYLLEYLFNDDGNTAYHEPCILRTFNISKGRLRRLQERKLGLRDVHHGLVGKSSACTGYISPSCALG